MRTQVLQARAPRPAACRIRAQRSSRAALRPVAAMALPADFKDSYVDLAHSLADAAAQVTRKYFRTSFDVECKSDDSPVTIADKQAEVAMREIIERTVPEHGIFGEEHGLKWGSGAGSKYMWVLDPIDGTKSFITGKPLFGTLISLVYEGSPILGIIDQPITKERWLGVVGRPTTLNGQPLRTRPCPDVKLAYLYATTPHMFSGESEVAFNRLRDSVRIPMYGCDCYAYGLLAAGHADLVVEADLKPYDYMALVPVVQGAGGVMSDWRGRPLVWQPTPGAVDLKSGWPGEVCAAGDPALHKKAIDILAWKH
ncbi:hypothetical protein CHLRE_17g723550v5 [Chlamydomonas reinhardtii]|uniref:histidinol-phosphatase n=1 Tax=Chlamydomonas reinhardtii TaxID=3055 RepID=A8J6J4_CHLRE|nr:inositol monophosphatase family protein [Chlamydomonas reinhardtii]PNW70525.1 hypothetical protein CHLRE_17g723550v5 [Chlamydomonas reinhardtii]|eukprot:XP_001697223.1 inositol monophosphatase family protein [Chlamydomonas reinhardtii]